MMVVGSSAVLISIHTALASAALFGTLTVGEQLSSIRTPFFLKFTYMLCTTAPPLMPHRLYDYYYNLYDDDYYYYDYD